MSRFVSRLAATLVAAALPVAASAATLTHDYELNGSLADSLGGPALVSLGGTLGANGYGFSANQGLVYTGGFADAGSYSIDIRFSLDDRSGGYAKIIDYLNQASDNGLYALGQRLEFFPVNNGVGPQVFDGQQMVDVMVTRDAATGLSTGWVNGVQVYAFNDTTRLSAFDSASHLVNFFLDDTHTSGREATSGYVDSIRIYDGALSAPVPEPETAALFLAGLGLLVARARRRG